MSFNRCMKTGVWFASPGGPTRTGDLFLQPGGLQILGVPDPVVAAPPDIVIAVCVLTRRLDLPRYSDTEVGLVIVSCSDEFRKHVVEWAPQMLYYLPAATVNLTDEKRDANAREARADLNDMLRAQGKL